MRRRDVLAENRDPSSSGLTTSAEPPTGGCHGLWSKHSVKLGDHLMTIETDGRAPRGGTYSVIYAREYQAYIEQKSIFRKVYLTILKHGFLEIVVSPSEKYRYI